MRHPGRVVPEPPDGPAASTTRPPNALDLDAVSSRSRSRRGVALEVNGLPRPARPARRARAAGGRGGRRRSSAPPTRTRCAGSATCSSRSHGAPRRGDGRRRRQHATAGRATRAPARARVKWVPRPQGWGLELRSRLPAGTLSAEGGRVRAEFAPSSALRAAARAGRRPLAELVPVRLAQRGGDARVGVLRVEDVVLEVAADLRPRRARRPRALTSASVGSLASATV